MELFPMNAGAQRGRRFAEEERNRPKNGDCRREEAKTFFFVLTMSEKIEESEYSIETDSGEIMYTIEKKSRTLRPRKAALLIHGVGIGYGYYDLNAKDYSMMNHLTRGGLDVFAVDQRGYGKSSKPDGLAVRAEACADDLKSVIDLYHNLVEQSYPRIPTGPFLDMELYEYSNYVPRIAVPTLLINGELEEVVGLGDALQCLHDLGATQKDLLFLGNAWHLAFLEKIAHRRQNTAVLTWLLQ